MAWLEIIEIRAIGSNQELLESQISDFIISLNQETGLSNFNVYKNVVISTDYSIHFFHNTVKKDTSCSHLCTHLASSLKDIGLVNQTVWIEKFHKGDRNEKGR